MTSSADATADLYRAGMPSMTYLERLDLWLAGHRAELELTGTIHYGHSDTDRLNPSVEPAAHHTGRRRGRAAPLELRRSRAELRPVRRLTLRPL